MIFSTMEFRINTSTVQPYDPNYFLLSDVSHYSLTITKQPSEKVIDIIDIKAKLSQIWRL